jgi:hypothetical protein
MKNKNKENLINHRENHDDTDLVKSKGDQLLSNLFKKRLPMLNDPNPTTPEINQTTTNDSAQRFMHNELGNENIQPEKAAFDAYENAIKLLPKD